ncbi:MAG: PepSY-associated TM helix domain-containing protein [Acidimicrobiia bacterium]|nr:PepSY-associated TM helix domain-containing protein [Acidimicrobiia bacterium]
MSPQRYAPEQPTAPAGAGARARTAPLSADPAHPPRRAIPERITSGRRGRQRAQKAMRLVHVYTSMLCLLIVLFFSVTGLTLNHPNWSLGGDGSRSTATGSLPDGWRQGDQIDWVRVVEHLRAEYALKGTVSDYGVDGDQGRVTWKGPAYSADAFLDISTGAYDLTVQSQGPLAFMNDLHKGRDTTSSWNWLIDGSAVFLIVVSATGLLLQLLLRARRRSALITALGGAIAFVVFTLVVT